jgi:membrane protease YdiL (CAAX protease family)
MIVAVESISKFSFFLADQLYPQLRFLDYGNAFLYITLHHMFQGLIALALILWIARVHSQKLSVLGLNLNQWKFSVRRVVQFAFVWFIIQFGIGYAMMVQTPIENLFSFELNVKNYVGYFLFQILLSGTSEELLYRSLLIGGLLLLGRQLGFSDKKNIAWAAVTSMIAFIIGHVVYTLSPFQIIYYNVLQLLTVVIFGTFYTYLFIKTKSVFGSMLAHNVLNGVIVFSTLLLAIIFGG